ncbi:MAG: D-alanyl-D-alanine carboxypeptidase [Chromatiales bacterium]|nr:D-alanyl-D-alanine carboxypeptidase [Chromatiales bacterium]
MIPLALRAFAAALLLFVTTAAVLASTVPVPSPPAGTARAYLLVDHNSGQVLASLNEHERLDPASITKLMTAYAAFRALRDGRINLDDEVTVSERAWRTGGSRTFIEVGSRVTVSDLLQGMIVQSGNDASVALAEHIAGAEDTFAQLMNQHAAELGMNNTSYRNSTGLPAADHFTSAADIATLASAIIREFPEYYSWYSQLEFTYNGITQRNRNTLLTRNTGVDGLKTGYTESAGYCLVTSAERDGMRLIAVILGTGSPNARARESEALLNYGFRFFETRRLFDAGSQATEARIWKGERETTPLGTREAVYVTVPRGAAGQLDVQFELPAQLLAPVHPDSPLGQLRVTLGGETLREAALFPLEPVATGSFWQRTRDSVLLWFQ